MVNVFSAGAAGHTCETGDDCGAAVHAGVAAAVKLNSCTAARAPSAQRLLDAAVTAARRATATLAAQQHEQHQQTTEQQYSAQ